MAYNYFYNEISNYVNCADSPTVDAENKIYGLFQALRTGLVLVVIELEENDDPQVIFETLNARGQPLLPSDLIRNTIFYQASNDPLHTGDDTTQASACRSTSSQNGRHCSSSFHTYDLWYGGTTYWRCF